MQSSCNLSFIRKLDKAVAVSGVFSGAPEEDSRKNPGKENCCGNIFPKLRNGLNSRIWGEEKGKLAANLGFMKSTFTAFSSFSELSLVNGIPRVLKTRGLLNEQAGLRR